LPWPLGYCRKSAELTISLTASTASLGTIVSRSDKGGSVLAKSCVARGKSDTGLAERVSLQEKATQVVPNGCRSRKKQRRFSSNGDRFSPNRCRSRKKRHPFGPMEIAPEKSDTGFTKRRSLTGKAASLSEATVRFQSDDRVERQSRSRGTPRANRNPNPATEIRRDAPR